MSSGRRQPRDKPIPLQDFVWFICKPFPEGWQKALTDQDFKCIKCRRSFNHKKHGLKACFHHDEEDILRAICYKCNGRVKHKKKTKSLAKGVPSPA